MPSARHDSYRTLPVEERRSVQMLTPLLRLAVGLDASGTQKVQTVETRIANNAVHVYVRGEGDIDLELWAAERAADTFREVYGVPMSITKDRR